jgi:hypothetical protein
MSDCILVNKILVVAASPRDRPPLRLNQEIDQIKAQLAMSRLGVQFEVILLAASRREDLGLEIMKHKPKIVHLCVHGEEDGDLLLQDDQGYAVSAQ